MTHEGSKHRAQGACALAGVVLLVSWMTTPVAGQGRTPDGKPDLSGYWLGSFFVGLQNIETAKGVIVDPADGKIPYLPEMRAKATDIRTNRMADEPELHCFMSGVPHVMYVQFGFQIIQTPANVTMAWEFMNAFRIIPTDGRAHISPAIKLFQGDSVGRWEGDTLVIDTTNQNDRTWLDTAGNIHTDAIHVVERLTLADANTIRYEATIEDSKAYTQPWKVAETFKRIAEPNYEQYEFACIEGNRDLQHYTEQAGGKAQSKPQPPLPAVAK
ncbi:MAG TPA: hypothetical protein VM818_03145 [Vicinamibacterales bacterium]|jgi:hypothetical protein|nr:hypothetical protein [Vicinamibacterales bacterium]